MSKIENITQLTDQVQEVQDFLEGIDFDASNNHVMLGHALEAVDDLKRLVRQLNQLGELFPNDPENVRSAKDVD